MAQGKILPDSMYDLCILLGPWIMDFTFGFKNVLATLWYCAHQ